ncbi:hypothetical protein WR25_03358 isoform B [Diploscapter pachys]|uniref:Uncharacterized protein n=2 Tax=Diploscapter pachys TaxID=2018661 RepID=A0A2A2L3N8_9BILA|nr:hypothetical protein WR25_03358 isoform B [Diploscapter pachys]
MGRFNGKSVIVTGSSNGIGAATALQFAKEGAQVTITGRKVENLEKLHGEMVKSGTPASNIHIVVGDITNVDVQKKIIEETVSKFGKLDILVNNAGAAFGDDKYQGTSSPDSMNLLEKNLDLNLKSVMNITNIAKPHLIATKGEVVNISSIASLNFGALWHSYYCIAKAALDQLTRAQALELIAQEVRVNSVNPGIVATNFLAATGIPDEASKKIYDYVATQRKAFPADRVGVPDDIANVILFLADRKASYYIGRVFIQTPKQTISEYAHY